MKRRDFLKGMAGAAGMLLANEITASRQLFDNAGMIDQSLNVVTSRIQPADGPVYYGAEALQAYGADITDPASALRVEQAAAAESIAQAEEGTVVLQNNGILPLAPETTRVTLFGNAMVHTLYHKSKENSTVPEIPHVTFPEALQAVLGPEQVEDILCEKVYRHQKATTATTVAEAPLAKVRAWEARWQDTDSVAVVLLTRRGGEDADSAMWTEDEGISRPYLGLMQREKDLLEYLRAGKQSGMFRGIVVVLNTDQMMELGWTEAYAVDALVLAGVPGTQGFAGTANVLCGKVDASGRLADCCPVSSLSAPACTYAGTEHTRQWANLSDVSRYIRSEGVVAENHADDYVIYAEGIYVGYKYYETRYEDGVLHRFGASDPVGSTSGGAWDYAKEMAFPFGAGQSYTTFAQELQRVEYDRASDTYTLTVQVTNTGTRTGRSVVEVYAQTPYGRYEQQNGVEKAAIQLAGFEKTEPLEPGEMVTLSVTVERYLLASYDSQAARGYILSAGDYYFALGDNAHDALNNVLAAKGCTAANGMTDALGRPADGDASKTFHWTQAELDVDSYRKSRYTPDVEVSNQFDSDQLAGYGIAFTYLSRQDWAGTFPAEAVSLTATEAMQKDLRGDWYAAWTEQENHTADVLEQGTDHGLRFITLKDTPWEETETWERFLDQLTVDEMLQLRNDSNGCGAIECVALPSQARGDDGTCIQQGRLAATGKSGLSWVSEVMTARTWNKQRFAARGRMLGVEALYCGLNELWYGGGNLHRTAFGGRNQQYYSEDGVLGYYVGWYEARAMQALGICYGIKHFVLTTLEAW